MSERLAVTEFIASETDDIRIATAPSAMASEDGERVLPPTTVLYAAEQVRGGAAVRVLYRL